MRHANVSFEVLGHDEHRAKCDREVPPLSNRAGLQEAVQPHSYGALYTLIYCAY